jgi:hypothetical protein
MEKQQTLFRQVLGIIIFSIAMGYLETAVVVYLRDIFYPNGFNFPLTSIPTKTLVVELFREAATLIMLVLVGMLAGRTKFQRFAFFLMAFGIWDISYYVFLKAFLGWPSSLATWDILFLIPVPWVGPVWAPCVLSITMIFLAGMILQQENRTKHLTIPFRHTLLLIVGSIVVIFSFCIDPIQYLSQFAWNSIGTYMPGRYDWWWFAIGEGMILYGIIRLHQWMLRQRR